ncbi:MAG TPA: hypothetical protein VM537_14840, partial [Anaerolineae bacterium]|nr:hypothetical protein [Anaerolineae bacterium]
MIPQFDAQSYFVQDVLQVSLDEREGFFLLPSPESRVTGPTSFAGSLDGVLPPQDVSDDMSRDRQVWLQVRGQLFSAVSCGLSGLPHLPLYLRQRLTRTAVRLAGAVLKTGLALGFEATH